MPDESLHLAYGVDLIKQSVELEKIYARDACPEGIVGINSEQFITYVEYIADRRLERIGLPKVYEADDPFPWMSQATDLVKEKNFFETRERRVSDGVAELGVGRGGDAPARLFMLGESTVRSHRESQSRPM